MHIKLMDKMDTKTYARIIISDHVTDVGCRGFIISRILNSDIEKGTAINIAKNKVELRLYGKKEQIEAFVGQLKEELKVKYGNPEVIVGDIMYMKILDVPIVERAAQAHLLDQFDKGIGVLKELDKGLGVLRELDIGLKALRELPAKFGLYYVLGSVLLALIIIFGTVYAISALI